MATFEECMDTYKSEFKKMSIKYDEELLTKVAKGLGPALYQNDASKVACSDSTELETVKKNFLISKLGLEESEALDIIIKNVCEQLGSSNKNKYRAMFYYLLVTKFNKEEVYS